MTSPIRRRRIKIRREIPTRHIRTAERNGRNHIDPLHSTPTLGGSMMHKKSVPTLILLFSLFLALGMVVTAGL